MDTILPENKLNRRALLSPVAWLAASSVLAAAGNETEETLTPPAPQAGGPAEGITRLDPATGALLSMETWPDFALTDAKGRVVDLHRDLIQGKTVVLTFFYTNCKGSCPATTGRLVDLWHAMGPATRERVRFISVSVEPHLDTPAALVEWASDTVPDGADWHLLTGALADITRLRHFVGFYDLDPAVDADPRLHAAMVMMGNDRTHRWLSLPAESSSRQWRSTLSRCL
ncbi:MAG: SCO family protein [Akkermansiaceae bacterium]|nr:SCO family protein [Akkermansiaceae bacterium]